MPMTVSELQVKVNADTSGAESGLASLGSKVGSIGGGIATAFGTAAVGGIVAFGAAIAGSVAAASTFEASMSGISAVSGATAAEMEQLTTAALDLGAKTSFSATEAAEGIGELVKAGVSITDVLGGGAAAALNLAAAGGLSVAESASIASNAMNVFSLSGAQTGHVADVIAGAANASAIDVHDFGMSLSAAGAVAATVGIGFEDLATATAVMGQAGIKGSDAGTSLKTMLLNLTPASKAQIAVSKALGITTADGANKFFDASGKAKSLADIAGVLQTATAGLSQEQKIQALQTLFGTDAVRAAAIMAKAGAEGFNEMATSIGKVTAESVAAERLNNLKGDVEQLTGSLETAGIQIGMAFTPALRGITQGATDMVNQAGPILADFAEQSSMAIRGASTQIQDAWRTAQQALAGDWAPSDKLSPFINAVGSAGLALGKLRDFIGEVAQKASDMGSFTPYVSAVEHLQTAAGIAWQDLGKLSDAIGRVGGAAGTHEQKVSGFALSIKAIGTGIDLFVLNAGFLIDTIMTIGTVAADSTTIMVALGKSIYAAATGDFKLGQQAAHEFVDAVVDMNTAGQDWKTHSSAAFSAGMADIKGLVGSGSQAAAAEHGRALSSMVTAEEDSMGSMSVAAHTGMQDMQSATQTGMAGVASATETGMANAVGAVESQGPVAVAAMDAMGAGMAGAMDAASPQITTAAETAATGVVSAVDAQTPAATAATDAMGAGMVASLDAVAPAMAASAEGAAFGAVAAVQAQQGPASAAGQGVGDSLGSGMEGGILGWVGRIASAAAQLVSSALGAARAEADSHSPSKKTQKLGEDLADGLEIGLNKSNLGAEMQQRIRDFIAASREYIPVGGEIKRVEQEIKDVRDRSLTDALFRSQQMITVNSELLRLKADEVGKERDLIVDRQRLAQATRDISDAERGTLTERTAAIQLGATHAEQNVRINQLERDKIPLQQQSLQIERDLIGLDPDNKRAKKLQEEQAEIRKKSDLIDNTIKTIQLETRAQDLDADSTKNLNTIASAGAKIRREGLDDNVLAQQRLIDRIKDQIDVLGGEQSVFAANESVIKNATQNEIDYRSRLIAVFTAEGKPLADRVTAGLKLVDQLEKEGKISKELADKLRDVGKEADNGSDKTAALGNAASTATPQMDAAAQKAKEMADQAQRIADQAATAASKVDALSSSLGKLPDWFHAGSGSGSSSSLFSGGRATGGPVTAGRAYVVGEQRPEVFVPSRSGTILPSVPSYSSGGSGGDTYNFDLRNSQVYDGSKFEDLLVHALGRAQRGGRIVKVTR